MVPHLLPEDLNAEDFLWYMREKSCKLSIEGLHKHNSYNDILALEDGSGESISVRIGRRSLYNSLPEYMFHAINRFDDLPAYEYKEHFAEECQKQEREIEDARRFFSPFDILLLAFRTRIKEYVVQYTAGNKVMQHIIGDTLTEEQKQNRFIRQSLCFLPQCKMIRGNRTLMTFMLRKIFAEEGVALEGGMRKSDFVDEKPEYCEKVGDSLDALYAGNQYDEQVMAYTVRYWSEEDCDESFLKFVDEIERFRLFVQDYFVSVEEVIYIDVSHDGLPLRLSDTVTYNYLNYNANL